jgi:AFG3 family protein
MNEKVGMLSFPSDDQQFQKPYSQDTAKLIDEEVRLLVANAYQRTLDLITKERSKVEALAQALLEKEVLQRHDLVTVLGARPFAYDGQQNIDILNEGFKFPEKLLEGGGAADSAADAAAAGEGGTGGGPGPGGGGGGGGGKKVAEIPAGAIPVAS